MTAAPKDVIYSALTRDACFRRWATMVYQPRTAAAERLVRTIRSDPKFPQDLDDRERFMFWLRHGPRLPYHVRREAGPMWASYARWRRARDAKASSESAGRSRAVPTAPPAAALLPLAPPCGSRGEPARRASAVGRAEEFR
jgi:hypothetical protein